MGLANVWKWNSDSFIWLSMDWGPIDKYLYEDVLIKSECINKSSVYKAHIKERNKVYNCITSLSYLSFPVKTNRIGGWKCPLLARSSLCRWQWIESNQNSTYSETNQYINSVEQILFRDQLEYFWIINSYNKQIIKLDLIPNIT